jgi:hypothetical protein
MAMAAFLSRGLGELGGQDQQAVVAGPQVVAEVTEEGREIAAVPGPEGDPGFGGDAAGVVEPVEQPGQAVTVLLDGPQDLGQVPGGHGLHRRAVDRRSHPGIAWFAAGPPTRLERDYAFGGYGAGGGLAC